MLPNGTRKPPPAKESPCRAAVARFLLVGVVAADGEGVDAAVLPYTRVRTRIAGAPPSPPPLLREYWYCPGELDAEVHWETKMGRDSACGDECSGDRCDDGEARSGAGAVFPSPRPGGKSEPGLLAPPRPGFDRPPGGMRGDTSLCSCAAAAVADAALRARPGGRGDGVLRSGGLPREAAVEPRVAHAAPVAHAGAAADRAPKAGAAVDVSELAARAPRGSRPGGSLLRRRSAERARAPTRGVAIPRSIAHCRARSRASIACSVKSSASGPPPGLLPLLRAGHEGVVAPAAGGGRIGDVRCACCSSSDAAAFGGTRHAAGAARRF